MSNLDKTVLSDSLSSLSKTLLSPKAFSFLNNGNNLILNQNQGSAFSKRVEYSSNNKPKKKYIRPKFKKKLEEEEAKVELFTEPLNNIEKMKLMQKLENDEERLNNEINFLNNITTDTTVASINSSTNINSHNNHNKGDNNNGNNLNMIHLMAKKMLKHSIFGKYLINNKKPKKHIKEEDLENNFYTLQKYKNIIGMIEHLKHKIFKKKFTDFNYETFDNYLNDEDDKLFNQSLLKTMGINRFIKNAKECLYRKEKIGKRSQSRAYGLNSFKFNNIFQTQQKPTRFATTKKLDYYDQNNIYNKRNFGYYRPKRNFNISYFSSTNNSKDKIKNRRKLNNYNSYITKNDDSTMNSINYNLVPVIKKKKKYFSSEQNTIYNPEKSSSIPKHIKNNNLYKYNKNYNKNHGLNTNLLNKIRERINNASLGKNTKGKNKDNNRSNYHSLSKNKSLDYDSDFNYEKKYKHNQNMSSCSMNNIYESEESMSSYFNSSVEKDKIREKLPRKNNYDSSYITDDNREEENGIYKKNKNITTPELGAKFNNIYSKNDTSKYDNDNEDDHFVNINDTSPILVNINNLTNESCSKQSNKDNLSNRDKMCINFNNVNINNDNDGNKKILYNTIFSPKTAVTKKNNMSYLQKNKLIFGGKKKDISIKDNDKLSKEIWNNQNYKKHKNNKSALDINKLNINNNPNSGNDKSKNMKNSLLNSTDYDASLEDTNNKLSKTSVNYYKKNISKEGFIKDNSPIDLCCLLNITINEIKSRTKTYFKKTGFFYSEKENVIKATRAGTIIEMTLFKIDNDSNNFYFNTRIKTNDYRKEREIMRKLIILLNKKE